MSAKLCMMNDVLIVITATTQRMLQQVGCLALTDRTATQYDQRRTYILAAYATCPLVAPSRLTFLGPIPTLPSPPLTFSPHFHKIQLET